MKLKKTVCMKKVLFLLLLIIGVATAPCMATDHTCEQLLTLLKLSPGTATQEKVTTMLGKPVRVEESKKRITWYYDHANGTLTISWNKKSSLLEKYSFNNQDVTKSVFDTRTSKRLQSGVTDVSQALNILGTPKDMTIKEMTQEMHYAYQNNVLRLFFRNNTLVDYTLY